MSANYDFPGDAYDRWLTHEPEDGFDAEDEDAEADDPCLPDEDEEY